MNPEESLLTMVNVNSTGEGSPLVLEKALILVLEKALHWSWRRLSTGPGEGSRSVDVGSVGESDGESRCHISNSVCRSNIAPG